MDTAGEVPLEGESASGLFQGPPALNSEASLPLFSRLCHAVGGCRSGSQEPIHGFSLEIGSRPFSPSRILRRIAALISAFFAEKKVAREENGGYSTRKTCGESRCTSTKETQGPENPVSVQARKTQCQFIFHSGKPSGKPSVSSYFRPKI
jgi:hypothetical protein